MPSPNPTARRQYAGAAVATTLNGAIVSGATSFVIVSSAGWPTGAVGNFIVTIDRGLATEERIKCSAQSAGTVTVAASGRGFDSTTAQAHANGATVECTLSAFDADEWNQHTNAVSAVHGVAGSVVGTTDIQTLTQKTLTSPTINSGTLATPTINGGTLDAASTIGGISGTGLAAERTAWTNYTPTLANLTLGNGTLTAASKTVGKTVFFRIEFTLGSTSAVGTGGSTFTLPVAPIAAIGQAVAGSALDFSASQYYSIGGRILVASATVVLACSAGSVNTTSPFAWAVSDVINLTGCYEAA